MRHGSRRALTPGPLSHLRAGEGGLTWAKGFAANKARVRGGECRPSPPYPPLP